jgi:hypothetical protein
MGLTRRHLLSLLPALALNTAWAGAAQPLRFAAAWEQDGVHRIGLLRLRPGRPVEELAALEVPTRAHGVWVDGAGHLVAVARRPGDWMLRWGGPGQAPRWHWIGAERAFNGHALASPDGRWLYTTETDLESGAGLVGLRDARSLVKQAEWATQGMDPHQLLWDRRLADHLIVANGGIPTLPESGRLKIDLARMDSSLVSIDTRSGQVVGQWRLDDARLSLRHLAWSPDGRTLGVALQAEHEAATVRAAAPVLALFDGEGLRTVVAARALAGYGGDIAAGPAGFAVSCSRAQGLAHFGLQGEWRGFTALDEACALAVGPASLWAAGRPQAVELASGTMTALDLGPRRVDNHWSLAPR